MTFRSQARKRAALPLATRCYAEFDHGQRQKGIQIFERRKVEIDTVGPDYVNAYVEDAQGDYYVSVDWVPNENCRELPVHCDCEEFAKRQACPHLWGLFLELDHQGVTQEIPGSWPIFVFRREDEEPNGEAIEALDPAGAPKSRKVRAPDWTRQLRQVREASEAFVEAQEGAVRPRSKPRELHYLISPAKGLERSGLVLLFFHREGRKDGSWGKIKPLRLDSSIVESIAEPGEHRIVELLLECPAYEDYGFYRYGYNSYHSGRTGVVVPTALWDVLLPQLAGTGRLEYSRSKMDDPENVQTLAWDDGPPWRFELQVARAVERSAWRIEGRLERDGEQGPLSEPVFLLREGLVVLSEKVARLEARDSFGWIVGLRKSGAIYVPFSDQDKLVEELWQIPALPPTSLDEELRWDQVAVVPQPRMRISQPENKYQRNLSATVTFDYDGLAVGLKSMQSGLVDRAHSRVVLRDRGLEQDWLKQLHALGFRTPPYHQQEFDLELPPQKLPGATRNLVRAGWLVEAEGKLIRRPGEMRLSVTSSVDWFDLDGQVDYGGMSVGLPALLEALRRGEQFVTLGDGTQGMLPEDWLKKFGMLADLAETSEGDKLRFVPSQAAILDALLAAQPQVEVDARFEEVRQRLRTFAGVQPTPPPDSFQGTLRDYQTHGLGWLHFLREFRFGGCLADDMGLGKTVQVLALLEARRLRELPKKQPRRPSLAVVPRSLVFNWIEEARRFTPELRVLNYTGLDRKEGLARLDDYDLLVTTYGTLRRDILQFQELQFDYAILDEAQAIKNAASQSAKACRLIQADYRLAMSGTPIENHLGELWSLFEFLNPGMLGRSATLKLLSSGTDQENRALLAKALRPFILRRTKVQVLTELPEKLEQTLYCELEEQQRKLYEELRDHYRAALGKRIQEGGLKKSKIHVLEALLRLRQAACHPGLIDKKRAADPSAKLETLLEQLSEVLDEGHKALVFSQFTSLLALVREQLDRRSIPYEYLDGRTRNRQEKVERFQSDANCRLFLISLKAGGQGLNLTAADYVFILDPWWNPAVEAQAVDRAHRIGQERRVFAYRLIARDTVEEKILQLQASKRNLAEAIISEDNSVISSLTVEDLQLLLS